GAVSGSLDRESVLAARQPERDAAGAVDGSRRHDTARRIRRGYASREGGAGRAVTQAEIERRVPGEVGNVPSGGAAKVNDAAEQDPATRDPARAGWRAEGHVISAALAVHVRRTGTAWQIRVKAPAARDLGRMTWTEWCGS